MTVKTTERVTAERGTQSKCYVVQNCLKFVVIESVSISGSDSRNDGPLAATM